MLEQNMNKQATGSAIAGDQPEHAARVRALNDALRRTFTGGRVVMTAGVAGLPDRVRAAALAAVHGFDAFDAGNDPYREHDFGSLAVDGERFCWKIDSYDLDLRHHSPDAADPAIPIMVLTIMLAEEW